MNILLYDFIRLDSFTLLETLRILSNCSHRSINIFASFNLLMASHRPSQQSVASFGAIFLVLQLASSMHHIIVTIFGSHCSSLLVLLLCYKHLFVLSFDLVLYAPINIQLTKWTQTFHIDSLDLLFVLYFGLELIEVSYFLLSNVHKTYLFPSQLS